MTDSKFVEDFLSIGRDEAERTIKGLVKMLNGDRQHDIAGFIKDVYYQDSEVLVAATFAYTAIVSALLCKVMAEDTDSSYDEFIKELMEMIGSDDLL